MTVYNVKANVSRVSLYNPCLYIRKGIYGPKKGFPRPLKPSPVQNKDSEMFPMALRA